MFISDIYLFIFFGLCSYSLIYLSTLAAGSSFVSLVNLILVWLHLVCSMRILLAIVHYWNPHGGAASVFEKRSNATYFGITKSIAMSSEDLVLTTLSSYG